MKGLQEIQMKQLGLWLAQERRSEREIERWGSGLVKFTLGFMIFTAVIVL